MMDGMSEENAAGFRIEVDPDWQPVAGRPGIYAYDLVMPQQLPPGPAWSPFRGPEQRPGSPRPRYVPPPLPDGHARVLLSEGDHDDPSWGDWAEADDDRPWRIFDIPAAQRERWMKAEAEHQAMQAEIEALMDARYREPGWPNVPPGWTAKAPRAN